jgi:hypothetical protein
MSNPANTLGATTEKPCQYCGDPMKVPPGTLQRTHKKCRRQFRQRFGSEANRKRA